jgi:hypothetical protein
MAKLCSKCGKITLLDAYYLPNNASVCKNCYDEYLNSKWINENERVANNRLDVLHNYDDFDTWLDKRLKEIKKFGKI